MSTRRRTRSDYGKSVEPGAPGVIDAYAHVGLPRFQTVAHYRMLMRNANIGQAVLCSFDSSPDLAAIHAAVGESPDVFRGIGVPLGEGRAEIEAASRAQLDAGFSGLRLTDADVADRPWLLDIVAEAGGVAIIVGQASAPSCARVLVEHLARHESLRVVGGHFAGVDAPQMLADGATADLFSHPRFFVTFSRHGGFPAAPLQAWTEAMLVHTGWSRIMWGSEAPVLFLRNETMADAVAWVDRLAPTPEQRTDFFAATARALYFGQPRRWAPLLMPFAPSYRARSLPSVLWANGLPVEQSVAGRLLHGWLSQGGHGTLGGYLEDMLRRDLPSLPRHDRTS